MSDASLLLSGDYAEKRQQLRLERQARVGILRNPNDPPRPPTRKAQLMGKWINLRSSRRPRADQLHTAVEAIFADAGVEGSRSEDVVETARDGTVASINIAGLMESVAGLGTSKPVRTPYGNSIRPDRGSSQARVGVASPSVPPILTRETWLDDDVLPQQPDLEDLRLDDWSAHPARSLAQRMQSGFMQGLLAVLRIFGFTVLGLVIAIFVLGIASGIMG